MSRTTCDGSARRRREALRRLVAHPRVRSSVRCHRPGVPPRGRSPSRPLRSSVIGPPYGRLSRGQEQAVRAAAASSSARAGRARCRPRRRRRRRRPPGRRRSVVATPASAEMPVSVPVLARTRPARPASLAGREPVGEGAVEPRDRQGRDSIGASAGSVGRAASSASTSGGGGHPVLAREPAGVVDRSHRSMIDATLLRRRAAPPRRARRSWPDRPARQPRCVPATRPAGCRCRAASVRRDRASAATPTLVSRLAVGSLGRAHRSAHRRCRRPRAGRRRRRPRRGPGLGSERPHRR